MARVLLVRHAETDWNREGRVQGWATTALTTRGKCQARELAAALSNFGTSREDGVDSIVTSDLRRAYETACPVAAETNCVPRLDAGWRERNFGQLQGMSADELFEQHPELSVRTGGSRATRIRPDGGETLRGTQRRVLDAWNRLRRALSANETTVVVSHGITIRLLLGHVRGESLARSVLHHEQDNGGVSELELHGDDVRIVRENWTGYRR